MQKQQVGPLATAFRVPQTVALVGLPGSGKSTVGWRLAKRLDMPFIDSDTHIEARLGCSIKTFFRREGEAPFRDIESEVIAQALSEKPCILSTGGGVVLRARNRNLLRRQSIVVYLRGSVEDIFRRINKDQKRPLLQVANPLETLQALFQVRDVLYREVAHIIVETGRPSVHSLVNKIAMQIELGVDHDTSISQYPKTNADF